jgi:hypothetical protein
MLRHCRRSNWICDIRKSSSMTAQPLVILGRKSVGHPLPRIFGTRPSRPPSTIDHFVRLAGQFGQITWRMTGGTVGATLGADISAHLTPPPGVKPKSEDVEERKNRHDHLHSRLRSYTRYLAIASYICLLPYAPRDPAIAA